METLDTREHKGFTIRIIQDCDPVNPRTEWDNLGTMVCFHSRYNLGDKHDLSVEEAKELLKRKDIVALELWFYDHSVQSISCKPFYGRAQHAEWDSCRVGFIYITYEKIRKEYSVKRVTKEMRERITRYLKSEVAVYDAYIRGNVVGYSIEDKDGESVDSCWGFYLTDEWGLEELYAEELIPQRDALAESAKRKHQNRVKELVKNRVPLETRAALLA